MQCWPAALQAGVLLREPLSHLHVSSVVGVFVMQNILSWSDLPDVEFAMCLLKHVVFHQPNDAAFPLYLLLFCEHFQLINHSCALSDSTTDSFCSAIRLPKY